MADKFKLVIKNLHVSVDKKEILKGVNLTINDGDKIAFLGPNGNGKSTLFFTISGHPKCIVTSGTIFFNNIDVLKLSVDERSKLGIFLGLQNPCEVAGIINSDFLKNIIDVRNTVPIKLFDFYKILDQNCKKIKFPFEMVHRNLNENFSGGEKKRNEILQMLLIKPKIALLDEIDSGLDSDAIKVIAKVINDEYKKNKGSFVIISHYDKMLELINPNKVVVMIDGKIVMKGEKDLIKKISEKGFDFIKNSLNITHDKQDLVDECCFKKK
ncbi:MAG: Fe-S cluster assembly ATPase SufC [Bacilli bacterium]|nr:Fe-S cluster assembly ATPase SufC [Bacilli bacterium]